MDFFVAPIKILCYYTICFETYMKKPNELEQLKKQLKHTQEVVLVSLLFIGVALSYIIITGSF